MPITSPFTGMNLFSAPTASSRLTHLPAQLAATVLLPFVFSSCGKKDEPAPPAPPPAPVVEQKAATAPAPVVPKPVAAKPPGMRLPVESEPKAAVAAPEAKPAAPPERSPADAAAWQRWDRAAERMRDIGATVRPSTNPLRLEIEVGQMSAAEARTVVGNAYNVLGVSSATVILYNAAGQPIAEASFEGVKLR